MKNFWKVLGIIALVAVIGFGVAACDDGSDDDNGGKDTPTPGGGAASVITITDIPTEHNGKYIRVDASSTDLDLYGIANETTFRAYDAMRSKVISGGTVALNTFHHNYASDGNYVKSTRSGTFDTRDSWGTTVGAVMILISSDAQGLSNQIRRFNAVPITISNGSVTLNFSTFVEIAGQ